MVTEMTVQRGYTWTQICGWTGGHFPYFLNWRDALCFVPLAFLGRHPCTNVHGIHWMIGTILVKIIKTVATRCQILWLECTKFNFGWGSASPDPLAGFKGPSSKEGV